eukprot:TRINITY_DN2361_c0_g1_i10.p1 TRINITY_DN2361_c0_g1~~TRINITY_DN2361_c0_g1_i10.p1  ORF type:complete len:714 (+),score=91.50 TRINITY_DN2361_c0_g1_i10:95-2143(+)
MSIFVSQLFKSVSSDSSSNLQTSSSRTTIAKYRTDSFRCFQGGRRTLLVKVNRSTYHRKPKLQKRSKLVVVNVGVSPSLLPELQNMLEYEKLRTEDPDKPVFHVMPQRGWMNDPNGPLYYNGRYHVFYQHIPNGSEWDWGIVWGHATSEDLIHWQHLPPALRPSPGNVDADGVFSGCCTVDHDNKPVILYTGVRLRSNPECGPLPPTEFDLQLPFIESQCMATADPDDPDLLLWKKQETPFLSLPPPNIPLTGWRDPFIYRRGGKNSEDEDWLMLMGSGIKDQGGTVLVYRSKELKQGWQYDGRLCQGDSSQTGAMWECPILLELQPAPKYRPYEPYLTLGLSKSLSNPQTNILRRSSVSSDAVIQESNEDDQQKYTHFFCVSPDAPTNPTLYYLGNMESENRFQIEDSVGPFRLDLGDILYAPNVMQDSQGRDLLWGWLQERRKVGTYEYAGCLSAPRMLYIRNDKLIQEPVPEVAELRQGASWHAMNMNVYEDAPVPLQVVGGLALDLEVTMDVIDRDSGVMSGLFIKSWEAGGESGAAILYNWMEGKLEAVFESIDPQTYQFAWNSPQARRIGGPLSHDPSEPLQLRVLIDHSCIEVYAGSGEVLSTRIYRGAPRDPNDCGIEFVSVNGASKIVRVEAYEVETIWQEPKTKEAIPRRSSIVDAIKLPFVFSPEEAIPCI